MTRDNYNRMVLKGVFIIHSLALLSISAYFLLLLFASGHSIDFGDSSQLKFIIEIALFFIAGIYLIKNRTLSPKRKWGIVILFVLVQVSFFDLYSEIASVEYDSDSVPIPFFIFFALLFISNVFIIYKHIKTDPK